MSLCARIGCAGFVALFACSLLAEAVTQEEMARVYREVATPHKVGVILRPEEGMMVDNPTVFRWGDGWRMLYIQYDKVGTRIGITPGGQHRLTS